MPIPKYDKMKKAQDLSDEVEASNTPDPAVRSAALDRLQESMSGNQPKPVAQDFALMKGKRLKRAGVPYANVLIDALKQKLGTEV